MTALPPATESPARMVVARARARPVQALWTLGLLVSLVALVTALVRLSSLGNDTTTLLRHCWYGAWTVGWMAAVTFHLRTLRLRQLVRGWLSGFFAAIGIVVVVVGMTEWLVAGGNLRTAFIVPIVEEVAKALPLAWLVYLAWRRRVPEPSITDFVVLGFAIGAGFGVHEDGLWVRSVSTGFGSSTWGVLFPSFLWQSPFVIAHAGWTGLVGLGVGLTWHFRRWRLGWVLAVVPLGLAIVDHVGINHRGDAAVLLRGITADGRLPAWVLLAGFVVAWAIDQRVMRTHLAADGLPTTLQCRGMLTAAMAMPTSVTRAMWAIMLVAHRRGANGRAYLAHRGDPREAIAAWRRSGTPDQGVESPTRVLVPRAATTGATGATTGATRGTESGVSDESGGQEPDLPPPAPDLRAPSGGQSN